jgi:hypothetical protein
MKGRIKYFSICRIFAFLFLFCSGVYSISAQSKVEEIWDYKFEVGEYYIVTLNDGTQFIGTYLETKGGFFKFSSNKESLLLAYGYDVKNVKKIDISKVKNGRLWEYNHFSNKYIIGESAYNIKRKEIRLHNSMLFFTGLEYGISNHISISSGLNLLPYLDAGTDRVFRHTLKVGGFNLSKKITWGISADYASVSQENFGTLQSVFTYGNRNSNFTFGMGALRLTEYVYTRYYGDYKVKVLPMISGAGTVRLTSKFYVLTENWYALQEQAHFGFSLGLRLSGFRYSISQSLIHSTKGFLPLLSFVYRI